MVRGAPRKGSTVAEELPWAYLRRLFTSNLPNRCRFKLVQISGDAGFALYVAKFAAARFEAQAISPSHEGLQISYLSLFYF